MQFLPASFFIQAAVLERVIPVNSVYLVIGIVAGAVGIGALLLIVLMEIDSRRSRVSPEEFEELVSRLLEELVSRREASNKPPGEEE